MSWNYRIVKKIENNECFYGIHEVYYHKDGSFRTCTVNPIEPFGETVDELKKDIELMMKAFELPVLNYEEI